MNEVQINPQDVIESLSKQVSNYAQQVAMLESYVKELKKQLEDAERGK